MVIFYKEIGTSKGTSITENMYSEVALKRNLYHNYETKNTTYGHITIISTFMGSPPHQLTSIT